MHITKNKFDAPKENLSFASFKTQEIALLEPRVTCLVSSHIVYPH